MRRATVAILLFSALGAVVLCAADFWKEKPFTQWSEKEAERMLSNSPWAHTVDVPTDSMAMHAGALRPAQMGAAAISPESVQGRGVNSDMGGRASIRGGGPNASAAQPTPSLQVRLRWVSALPVRQAVARQHFGDEAGTSAEAARMILGKSDGYVLAVAGLPPNLRGTLSEMKDRAELHIKGREPLAPFHIQPADQQQDEVYLFFPKAEQGGRDISVDDGSVEIVLKLEGATVRSKFDLKKMIYYDKLRI